MRDVERPNAPSSMAWATAFSMASSSAAVAGLLSFPTTISRTPPAPTNVPRLMAGRARWNAFQYPARVVKSGVTP